MPVQILAPAAFLLDGIHTKVRRRTNVASKGGSGDQSNSLRVGFIADIQYADKPDRAIDNNRVYRYREVPDKTRAFVSHMNDLYDNGGIDIAIHLGDMIDGNETEEKTLADLELIEGELQKVQCPFVVVLGNHCLDAGSLPVDLINKWNRNVGFAVNRPFYSISIKKKWRIVCLFSMGLSNRDDCENQLEAQKFQKRHQPDQFPQMMHAYNGGIEKLQTDWLKLQLQEARYEQQKVILAAHHPMGADSAIPKMLSWSQPEVQSLISMPENCHVLASFSGHWHPGGYSNIAGCHYVTVPGVVEASSQLNSYYVATFDSTLEEVQLKGFGVAESRTLKMR